MLVKQLLLGKNFAGTVCWPNVKIVINGVMGIYAP